MTTELDSQTTVEEDGDDAPVPTQQPINPDRVEDKASEMGAAMMVGALKGMIFAIPLSILAMFVLVIALDQPWNDALATAWLPGILVGVFFGGFAGVATKMEMH